MQISFDIGGTFTDLVMVDQDSGRTWMAKTLTTYDDLARAVSNGIASLLEDSGVAADEIERAVIGATTLVTNALIERRGARTALITTRGFADVIEIGREWRYDLYDLRLRFPEPLVPAELRFEVTERMLADGSVDTPLVLADVDRIVPELLERGVESVAICLLNSYANARHEQLVAAKLEELAPDLLISTSAQVAPEIREFERTQTTVANAYVRPIAGEHFAEIERAIAATGVAQRLLLMQSNGGITETELARRFPLRLLESGPAAGALGAAYWARQLDIRHMMAFDMGGTTAKVCLIDDGQPRLARTFEVARSQRYKRGSGMQLHVPVIDLLEIGAGGGSIAALDTMGLLAVGPESAGSEPGPACYGLGGERPTVTDADVVLGYLDPEYFLGGRMALDAGAAYDAIARLIAGAFGGDVTVAAAGIVKVVEENMAAAMRIHATEQGRDPGDYAVFAFGGAAPVHAASVARRLGARQVIVPAAAGVLAATGLQVAPPTVDVTRTRIMPVSGWDAPEVAAICVALREEALARLGSLSDGGTTYAVSADMRFRGQGFEIEVDMPQLREVAALNGRGPSPDAAEAARLFRERYEQLRGSVPPAGEPEITAWRLSATARWDQPELAPRSADRAIDRESGERMRRAWFESTGVIEVPVVRHLALRAGDSHAGPLIVQQPESTIVVGPDDEMTIDEHGNVHLTLDYGSTR